MPASAEDGEDDKDSAEAAEGAQDKEDGEGEEEKGLPGGWENEEERTQLLESLQPGTEDDVRVPALLDIRDKASVSDNWEALWADTELRAALLACADPPDPDYGKNLFADEEPEPPTDKTRAMSITILVNLASSPANRLLMAADPLLRHCLVSAVDAGTGRPWMLQQRAFMALSILSLAGACEDPCDDHIPSRPPTPKMCEVCGVQPCVCNAGVKEYRSSDLEVCNAMMQAASSSQPAGTRVHALSTLASLVLLSTANAQKLWGNRQVRRQLLPSCSFGQPGDVRNAALGALLAFSCSDDIQARMWSDEAVREALLSCAAANVYLDAEAGPQPQVHEVRSKSFNVMENLATERLNQEGMWNTRRLSAVVLQTVAGGGPLRADALRVLVELSKCYRNVDGMAEAGVKELLAAAAEDKELNAEDRVNCGRARDRLIAGSDGHGGKLHGPKPKAEPKPPSRERRGQGRRRQN